MRRLLIAAVVAAGMATTPTGEGNASVGMTKGKPEIQSLGKLAFAPEGVLLVGDSSGAAVWALDLGDRTPFTETKELRLEAIDRKIAALLGTTADEVLVHDLAVNPISQNVYLSVSRGLQKTHRRFPVANDAADARILLRVTPAGELQEVPLENVSYARAVIPDPPKADAKMWDFRSRSFTVTDLAYAEGKVYVAGLSNEEFASALRVLDYPFAGKVASTTLEVYHTAHGKWETEAPIETFLPYRLNGRAYLLAAYTCTPLATFVMDEMKPGTHLKGVTVAEFGAGNFPVDMITFRQKGKEFILLANSHRAVLKIDPAEIEAQKTPLTTPVEGFGTAGVRAVALPVVAVQQLDRLNEKFAVVLHRSVRDGALNLGAIPLEVI
jgi:hypothetical protein